MSCPIFSIYKWYLSELYLIARLFLEVKRLEDAKQAYAVLIEENPENNAYIYGYFQAHGFDHKGELKR